MSAIVASIKSSVKDAMRAKDKLRLGVIRMALSAVKQAEIDNNTEATDDNIIAILTKMVKQRKDSFQQFTDGDRADLAEIEKKEMDIIAEFLPQPLSDEEVTEIVKQAIAETGATSMQQMGAVMAIVKPQVQGRGDMSVVSKQVKALLG